MHKYRILEVVSGFGLGGAEKALITRINYLPVTFEQFILNVRPEIDMMKVHIPIEIHKVSRQGVFRLFAIFTFLLQNSFDVIIVRTPLDAVRFGLLKFILGRKKTKLIFEAHSNFVSTKIGINIVLTYMLRLISRNFNLTIAVSKSVAKGPLCRGHNNVYVVYLGAQIAKISLEDSTPRTPRLLFVGRLVELKRPIWLLERLKNINSTLALPKSTLTIVGAGPLELDLKNFIVNNQLDGIVHFAGMQENVTPFYEAATHLVSCSTNEGLPLTFFEAKLAGLSILSTPSGGGREILGDEDYNLKSFDAEEFEEALLQILTSPPPSSKTRQTIQKKSKWMNSEEGAKRYYDLVSYLLSS